MTNVFGLQFRSGQEWKIIEWNNNEFRKSGEADLKEVLELQKAQLLVMSLGPVGCDFPCRG